MNRILDFEQINLDKREDQDLGAEVFRDSNDKMTAIPPLRFSRSQSGKHFLLQVIVCCMLYLLFVQQDNWNTFYPKLMMTLLGEL